MSNRGNLRGWISAHRVAVVVSCALIASAGGVSWWLERATDTSLVDPIVMSKDVELRSGDIILTGGVSLQSRMIRSLTADNIYSHVGILEVTPKGAFVLHTSPSGAGDGGAGDGGAGDHAARLPLSTFLGERGYIAARVVRLRDDYDGGNREVGSPLAADAHALCAAYVEEAVPFDTAFDLSEQDRLYCSEMVWQAYQRAGFDWPETIYTDQTLTMAKGPVILPGSFASCADFHTVWRYPSKVTP